MTESIRNQSQAARNPWEFVNPEIAAKSSPQSERARRQIAKELRVKGIDTSKFKVKR